MNKIMNLKLRNFKGCKFLEINFAGKNCSIYGDNGTGKTTVFDGFCWLLTDKDSLDKADFEIKTIDNPGVEHEVEGIFKMDDSVISLRKIYKEKWIKKRGATSRELSGHTTDYFVDDVPVKAKEYKERISTIVEREDLFKLLTQPTYFNTKLHWLDRRKLLLDICGDISDQVVIDSDCSLKALAGILCNRSLEDHKKIVSSKQVKINEEIKKIPVRIDEQQRGIKDISGINLDLENLNIKKIDQQIEAETSRINQLKTGGAVAEKKNNLSLVNSQLLDLKTKHTATFQAQIDVLEAKKRTFSNELSDYKIQENNLKLANTKTKETVENCKKKMEALRIEWRTVDGGIFQMEQDKNCPTCKRPLPEDKLKAAYDIAEKMFNIKKSDCLENITKEGKSTLEDVTKLHEIISDNETELKKLQINKDKLQVDIDILTVDITELNRLLESYQDDAKYKELLDKKTEIENQISSASINIEPMIAEIESNIKVLKIVKAQHQSKIDMVTSSQDGLTRIEELKKEERALASEYEKLENELFLCESFIKTKANLLEKKINNKFKLTKFKLFHQNINGGIEPTCEAMYQNVPYSTGLNNSMKINLGLDIINTLSDYYNIHLPCFIDNAEAITEIFPFNSQVIKLIVSKEHKILNFKLED